jgi:hypothetical protein
MVVLGCGLFIGASIVSWLHTGSAVSAASRDVATSRALARSGLSAIAAELDRQRRTILRGEAPDLEPQYTVFDDGDHLGVVRLLPVGLRGELLVSEAGKLDLNLIDDTATLVATGLVLPDLAEEIIRHRDEALGRPFQSELELLGVPGMTPEILYGELSRLIDRGDDWLGEAPGMTPGLVDVLTVYSVEPALQENGKLRINLNVEWSEELEERVADRFGDEIAGGLKQIFDQGVRFDSERRMFELLRFFQVAPEEWHEPTDSFTTERGQHHRGRLDLNRAPYEALRALPGIEFEQAAQLASAQESLTSEERKSVAWPLMLGVLEPEQMDGLGGAITTRSWTWRVRFEAGMVSAGDPDGELEGRVTYEAVIDLASPRPRIAYLRDITLLSDAVLIASRVAPPSDEQTDVEFENVSASREETDHQAAEAAAERPDDGLDFGMDGGDDNSLDFGGEDRNSAGGNEEENGGREDDDGEGGATGEPAAPQAPARIGRWMPGK